MANSSPSPKARNTTIIFITVVTLLLMLSYYLFVYVPAHEEIMHEQHTRVLNKIAQNVKAKLGSTINNARNIAGAATFLGEGNRDLKELKTEASYYNENIVFEDLYPADSTFAFDIYLDEKKYGEPSIFITDSVHVRLCGEGQDHSELVPREYVLSISAEKLVSNLLRFDHFEKFTLFSPDRALFETHPTGSKINMDSLFSKDELISSSQFREVTYGGVPHIAYFRPLRFGDDKNWILTGFVSTQKIAAQKFSLSPLFSIILLLFIILTFLSIPFIKIKIMHVREHLTLKEVGFSFISVTFIISILILLVLMGYSYWGIDKPNIEQELQTLSGDIKKSLTAEIESVLKVLKNPDQIRDIDGSGLIDYYEDQDLLSFENIFFIDGKGNQDPQKKSLVEKPTPVINIKSRRYFSKAKNPEILCSEGFVLRREEEEDCFYLESIISYNTGKQLAAVSMSTEGANRPDLEKLPVVAMTGRFHSIIETVLPHGYGFSILSNEGDVLFHNNSNLNLQENFFEELEASESLEAHIFGRKEGVIKTDYHDKSTLLHVAPVGDWPLTLVTYYDTSLLSLKYLEIFTLYVTICGMISFGLLMVLGIGYLVEKSSTVFWGKEEAELIPSLENLPPQKAKKQCYHSTTFLYLALLPLFVIWAWFANSAMSIFLSVLLVCLEYWILRYFFSDHSNHTFWVARMVELVAFGIGSSLIIIHLLQLDGSFVVLPLSLVALILLGGWSYHGGQRSTDTEEPERRNPLSEWINRFPLLNNKHYLEGYCRVIFLGSFSFSLLMTSFVYRACYLQETEALQKYSLVQHSRAIAEHETDQRLYYYSLLREEAERLKPRLEDFVDLRIDEEMGIYHGETRYRTVTRNVSAGNEDRSDKSWMARWDSLDSNNDLAYFFIPYQYQPNTKSDISVAHVFNDTSRVKSVEWKYSDGQLYSRIRYNYNGREEETPKLHQLSIDRASFGGTTSVGPYLVGLLLLAFIVGGYSMVKQIVRQLFVLRTPENYQFNSDSYEVNLKKLKKLLDEQKHLYLVTIPMLFRKVLSEFRNDEYELVDWNDLSSGALRIDPNRQADSNKPLVVAGFDHTDEGKKIEAMRMLEKAMPSTEVILVSNFDPLDLLQRTRQQENPETSKEHDALADLLAEFETYYFPLTKDLVERYQAKSKNQDLLVKELNTYYELWNSLTPDEQYVLYDLTHDGLVNTQNLPIIHRLYKKGLITDEGNSFTVGGHSFISSLNLLNERFGQFIDNLAETEDLEKLEEEINATGTWRKYRTPLILTLTGILVFVFITQQDTYGEVVSVLGSIAASLPLLLKLLNSFFKGRAAIQTS